MAASRCAMQLPEPQAGHPALARRELLQEQPEPQPLAQAWTFVVRLSTPLQVQWWRPAAVLAEPALAESALRFLRAAPFAISPRHSRSLRQGVPATEKARRCPQGRVVAWALIPVWRQQAQRSPHPQLAQAQRSVHLRQAQRLLDQQQAMALPVLLQPPATAMRSRQGGADAACC